ncbi:hypothetical protein [Sphingosinicella microcystinivorans]|uniref:hypothetical protein n=1 Tax=Sphingosinicella microcystinivorans TaxID=335406 RepID=UPI00135C5621|nr:hypothetical protein [Sphingosinicella microcystinivorans]
MISSSSPVWAVAEAAMPALPTQIAEHKSVRFNTCILFPLFVPCADSAHFPVTKLRRAPVAGAVGTIGIILYFEIEFKLIIVRCASSFPKDQTQPLKDIEPTHDRPAVTLSSLPG